MMQYLANNLTCKKNTPFAISNQYGNGFPNSEQRQSSKKCNWVFHRENAPQLWSQNCKYELRNVQLGRTKRWCNLKEMLVGKSTRAVCWIYWRSFPVVFIVVAFSKRFTLNSTQPPPGMRGSGKLENKVGFELGGLMGGVNFVMLLTLGYNIIVLKFVQTVFFVTDEVTHEIFQLFILK